ncbi:MAG: glycerate kinase [Bacillota bacterium]|nr:glycerate kinase [Bacillota bacterium]
MKILIGVDSFKDSLSAIDVSKSIKKGIIKVNNRVEIMEIPLADGGEGTMEIIVNNLNGKIINTKVVGPLGEKINGSYGIVDEDIAIIEMATVAGLELLKEKDRNPSKTTTYGVGQLILDALDKGCKEFVVAIGGSSTNDGGIGLARALGVKFLDNKNSEIELNGNGLKDLVNIDISEIDKRIKESKFQVACDVDNVLCGENGAAYVYARQKGANDKMIEMLDKNLFNLSEVIKKDLGKDVLNIKGAGAAGGLGGGLVAFLDASLKSGFDIVSNILNLESEIKSCDLVITGEGSFDYQSLNGKVPIGVAKLAKKYNKKVIVIAGSVGEISEEIYENGVTSVFSIISKPSTLEELINKKTTENSLESLAEQIIRLLA